MSIEEVKQVADYFKDLVRAFVPYSSNRPSLKNQPFHRLFWLDLVRRRNDECETRERIRKWHMNLEDKDEEELSALPKRKVQQTFFGAQLKNPTFGELSDYIMELEKRSKKRKHEDGKDLTPLEAIESRAKNAVKFGIGNCGEMARLAFVLLMEYKAEDLPNLPPLERENIMIELVRIPGKGDHAFVVVDRDPLSNLNNVETWGPNAIILDPWMNDVVEVAEQLQNPTSWCFKYIKSYQNDFQSHEDHFSFIGEGHTKRWENHRQAKNESVFLRDWEPFYNGDNCENVPWMEEVVETSHPSKKRRFS